MFPDWKCPKCSSRKVKIKTSDKPKSISFGTVKCQDCGHEWEDMLY